MVIARKCYHKQTKQPLSVQHIVDLLKIISFKVNSQDSTKKQALDAIRQLQEKKHPIARAYMRISIVSSNENHPILMDEIKPHIVQIEFEGKKDDHSKLSVILINPDTFRKIYDSIAKY